MTTTNDTCALWLAQAQIAAHRLTAEQRGLLQAAFAFRERCGDDYYSSRLLSHFLLHCDSGLGAKIGAFGVCFEFLVVVFMANFVGRLAGEGVATFTLPHLTVRVTSPQPQPLRTARWLKIGRLPKSWS